MKKNKSMIIVFLTPAILSYIIIFLYPSIRTAIMSFYHVENITDSISKWKFVGYDNYLFLKNSSLFIQSMKNLVNIWFWGGIIVFVLAITFAVILTSGVKGKSFYRAIIYLPNVVSAVAMGTMWMQYVYSSRYGLLKNVFETIGMKKAASIQWTSPDMIFISLLIAYCFGMVGYYMLIFMAAIERIPQDFYEAATLAGANGFQKFRHITLPLLKDVFRTNIVLWTITSVAFFIWSQVFSPLNPEPGTVAPMVYMYQMVFGNNMVVTDRNVGAGAAVGIVLTLIVVIMFVVTSKLFKEEKYEY
ncbi:carbohydrate ABC transporter permease [Oceanirhabdus sp. W0125-5]|uniref:carbohydrate ABC transporter permease n=1 Tax=Oceanirhabdus sp. W0125-5 TaxID=2999116 RepID=UPI0022F2B69B|nr:sugar ABC transporter permease [Oceanirhabdus sp. W0125-5]WBW98893.1 sugar ABC transporter permease [Oceanirhabdus sp. W0125-5]